PGSARSLAVRFCGRWRGRVEVDPLLVEVDGPAAVAERREPEHAVESKAVDGRVLVKEAPGSAEILAGELAELEALHGGERGGAWANDRRPDPGVGERSLVGGQIGPAHAGVEQVQALGPVHPAGHVQVV